MEKFLRRENEDMQITKIMPSDQDIAPQEHRFTQEQLQQEFNYMQAEKITKKLREKGLITEEEYRLNSTTQKSSLTIE
ncbi:MAG: hypothetical protein K6E91_04935 [Butyrivibrio sp.]|nr:hypothetical protein [Butyrivibrio sp.]